MFDLLKNWKGRVFFVFVTMIIMTIYMAITGHTVESAPVFVHVYSYFFLGYLLVEALILPLILRATKKIEKRNKK